MKYLPLILSNTVSQQTVSDWYWSTGISIDIPNIKGFSFLNTSRYDTKSWKQWVLRGIVTGRVEQEDARTEKEAERLKWWERGGLSNPKGGGRLSGIVANHNFECTSSLKSFKSSLKPLEMNYTYLYFTYNVYYVWLDWFQPLKALVT